MMPVIRIPDSVYERLQKHATPFVDTPATVIERLLNAYETRRSQTGTSSQAELSSGSPSTGIRRRLEKEWEVPSGETVIPCYTRLSTTSDGRYDRVKIFGYRLMQILRSLGREGYTNERARRLMDALGLHAVRMNTIRTYIGKCRVGRAADLSAEQLAAFDRLVPVESSKADET